ncbi:MAG: hypothetical protein K0S58_2939 [Nitrospira sp.]|nr:hypothetical protein [Nitrospira sp.]
MEWLGRLFGTRSVMLWVALALFIGALLNPKILHAECTAERRGSTAEAAFTLRLSGSCTEAEREARAIPAQDVLRALASGKGIDLAGVVIEGDLLLDELPVQKMAAVQDLSPDDRRVLEGLNDVAVHVIRGPFVIKNARVHGRIVHRLKQGFLLVTGPVVLAQTRFEGSVDLSRTVFLGLVDGSSATFEQESYFVQDRFTQGAMFSDTHFGPHARFHRSIFAGPSIFHGAVFKGLTEFLEVVFEQDANFSHAAFHMGTGFSGAHCRGKCDFSSAQFDREAFFLFALFDRPVSFASARFESQADFSDASFKERDDLAQAVFAHPPLLTRTARVTATMAGRTEGSSSSQVLTIALFVTAIGLLLYIIRAK